MLYIYDRPVFIYDLYARRLLATAGYGEYRSYTHARHALDPMVTNAGFSTFELAKFHGLIVDGGKRARQLGGWEQAYPFLISGDFNAD